MSATKQLASRLRLLVPLAAALTALVTCLTALPARAIDTYSQPVRVLRMPVILDALGVHEITVDLADATASSATLVVIAPASPRLAASVSDGDLGSLATVSNGSSFLIVGGPGDVLPAFKRHEVHFTPLQSREALEARLGDRSAVDAGTLSVRPLASILGLPHAPARGGLLVLVVIVLGGLALAGGGIYALRGRPHAEAPLGHPGHPPLQPKRRPRPASSRPRPRLPSDASLPKFGRALVRTELEPDGYVELGGCLRRVRWAEPRLSPPAPGDWVAVRSEDGELIAVAKRSSANGRRP